jgi:hypothetical protein
LHGKYLLQAYGKISKQLGTSLNTGTFAPILAALKTSSDKLFQVDRESEKRDVRAVSTVRRYLTY